MLKVDRDLSGEGSSKIDKNRTQNISKIRMNEMAEKSHEDFDSLEESKRQLLLQKLQNNIKERRVFKYGYLSVMQSLF